MSLAWVEMERGSEPVHLKPHTLSETGEETAFDQRALILIFRKIDFVKNLLRIIGIRGETGRRCRYARGLLPEDSCQMA